MKELFAIFMLQFDDDGQIVSIPLPDLDNQLSVREFDSYPAAEKFVKSLEPNPEGNSDHYVQIQKLFKPINSNR